MTISIILISFCCLFNANLVKLESIGLPPPPGTSTKGPTTTTEVRNGMNLCDPLMKPGPRNGYEINFVICEAHEICQPLSSKGDLAEIGYSFFYSF